jgi:hypothetical protein
VGHSKGDGVYVLSHKPDYIILSSVAGDSAPTNPVFASDVEIKNNEEFQRCYKNYRVNMPYPAILNGKTAKIKEGFDFSYYKRECEKQD